VKRGQLSTALLAGEVEWSVSSAPKGIIGLQVARPTQGVETCRDDSRERTSCREVVVWFNRRITKYIESVN
jgi:hypothetical protein